MSEPMTKESLGQDLKALCEKHELESGMVAVTRQNEFLIVTCNMSSGGMRILGNALLQFAPPEDATLN